MWEHWLFFQLEFLKTYLKSQELGKWEKGDQCALTDLQCLKLVKYKQDGGKTYMKSMAPTLCCNCLYKTFPPQTTAEWAYFEGSWWRQKNYLRNYEFQING